MSRVGKMPVSYPDTVKVSIEGLSISVEGPKGKLSNVFGAGVQISDHSGAVHISPADESKNSKAMWGTARSIINNMVHGVSSGFSEELEIEGVGYRASIKGSYLNLALGKSHSVKVFVPKSIKVDCPKPTSIVLHSIDKQLLGQFAHTIISQCPPEPYKGKGIRKKGQYVHRKEGKKAK